LTSATRADTVTDCATRDRIAGNWKQLKGNAGARWGRLTDDDMEQADGNRDILVGKVQDAYGTTRMEAEQQVDSWAAGNEWSRRPRSPSVTDGSVTGSPERVLVERAVALHPDLQHAIGGRSGNAQQHVAGA